MLKFFELKEKGTIIPHNGIDFLKITRMLLFIKTTLKPKYIKRADRISDDKDEANSSLIYPNDTTLESQQKTCKLSEQYIPQYRI